MAEKIKRKPTIQLTTKEGETEEVTIDVRLSLPKLVAISRDFPEANDIATLSVGEKGMELDMIKLFKIVYLAYRQAHMHDDYYSFDDFQEMYEFDMQEATTIYFALLNKKHRTAYLEMIQRATPKNKDNSK